MAGDQDGGNDADAGRCSAAERGGGAVEQVWPSDGDHVLSTQAPSRRQPKFLARRAAPFCAGRAPTLVSGRRTRARPGDSGRWAPRRWRKRGRRRDVLPGGRFRRRAAAARCQRLHDAAFPTRCAAANPLWSKDVIHTGALPPAGDAQPNQRGSRRSRWRWRRARRRHRAAAHDEAGRGHRPRNRRPARAWSGRPREASPLHRIASGINRGDLCRCTG